MLPMRAGDFLFFELLKGMKFIVVRDIDGFRPSPPDDPFGIIDIMSFKTCARDCYYYMSSKGMLVMNEEPIMVDAVPVEAVVGVLVTDRDQKPNYESRPDILKKYIEFDEEFPNFDTLKKSVGDEAFARGIKFVCFKEAADLSAFLTAEAGATLFVGSQELAAPNPSVLLANTIGALNFIIVKDIDGF